MNISKIWTSIELKAEDDYFSLSDDERRVYSLRKVIDAINGRGLLSLYRSRDYLYPEDIVEDLYALEQDEAAAIIENANSMFPGGFVPEEPEERAEIIDSWDEGFDELFDQWTDDILEFNSFLEGAYNNLISSLE
ncbi:MAG: hypothetical protein IKB34_02835 [Clostridia bacterium]|nr:hypothetical protein [Clostridia bacterium]